MQHVKGASIIYPALLGPRAQHAVPQHAVPAPEGAGNRSNSVRGKCRHATSLQRSPVLRVHVPAREVESLPADGTSGRTVAPAAPGPRRARRAKNGHGERRQHAHHVRPSRLSRGVALVLGATGFLRVAKQALLGGPSFRVCERARRCDKIIITMYY